MAATIRRERTRFTFAGALYSKVMESGQHSAVRLLLANNSSNESKNKLTNGASVGLPVGSSVTVSVGLPVGSNVGSKVRVSVELPAVSNGSSATIVGISDESSFDMDSSLVGMRVVGVATGFDPVDDVGRSRAGTVGFSVAFSSLSSTVVVASS